MPTDKDASKKYLSQLQFFRDNLKAEGDREEIAKKSIYYRQKDCIKDLNTASGSYPTLTVGAWHALQRK